MNIPILQDSCQIKRSYNVTLLAHLAVTALLAEAELTPKPALVDQRGSGVHTDMTLALMKRSAWSLRPAFTALAIASIGQAPDQALRIRLSEIGRAGEEAMLMATGGVNTHRGAIWALGLLVAGAMIGGPSAPVERIAALAGEIARHKDRFAPVSSSHGRLMKERYGVPGAHGEAQENFPTVIKWGLSTLRATRQHGVSETIARLDALMALIAHLDDTCILYHGGNMALRAAQEGAWAVLCVGGTGTVAGCELLAQLEQKLLCYHASPGGSADLLAATLFLDVLTDNNTI